MNAPRPFPSYLKHRLEQLDIEYAIALAMGFTTAPFDGEPEPETLQCRNEVDMLHWLGLLLKCQLAVASGFGNIPIDPPIRCNSNREYAVTHADAMERMGVMITQYGLKLKNFWRLKDALRSCATRDNLMQVNLQEGWQ